MIKVNRQKIIKKGREAFQELLDLGWFTTELKDGLYEHTWSPLNSLPNHLIGLNLYLVDGEMLALTEKEYEFVNNY